MKKFTIGFFNLFSTVLGVSIGNYLVAIYPEYWKKILGNWIGNTPFLVMSFLFGAAFYLVSSITWKIFLEWYENAIKNIGYNTLWEQFLGGILGLIMGNLLFTVPYYFFYRFSLDNLEKKAFIVALVIKVFLPIGINLFSLFIGITLFSKLSTSENKHTIKDEGYFNSIILDTNILIDGRIYQLLKSRFLRGKIIVHEIVLHELQRLADSSDRIKRMKGRKGLNILEKIREEFKIEFINIECSGDTVDDKLLDITKKIKGILFTNDYNLAKIAKLQLIDCISMHELTNALKQDLIPGERVVIELIKKGKEPHQAIGYLEDGTMIVVENANKYIGRLLEVEITNILPTKAGRIVFAKINNQKRGEYAKA